MIICSCSFSDVGALCEEKLFPCCPEITWISQRYGYVKGGCMSMLIEQMPDIKDFVAEAFRKRLPVLFIGATGIAVRLLAEHVKDKFLDSPVLVMDVERKFVIPLLSGHVGGANELAVLIAERTGAVPVITTGSDVRETFAIDVFAKRNGFSIVNRELVKHVTGKLLRGEKAFVWVHPSVACPFDGVPPELFLSQAATPPESADIIVLPDESSASGVAYGDRCVVLVPKLYCVGIGCKQGKTFDEFFSFLEENLSSDMLENMCAIASIDLKSYEIGLMEIAQYHHVPFKTYSAEELDAVPGEFSESEFVKEKTGVSNVCERAAVKCAGEGGVLVCKKIAKDGMTVAVAKRKPKIVTWKTDAKEILKEFERCVKK